MLSLKDMEHSAPIVWSPTTVHGEISTQAPSDLWAKLSNDLVYVQNPSLVLTNYSIERRRLFQNLLDRYFRISWDPAQPLADYSLIDISDRYCMAVKTLSALFQRASAIGKGYRKVHFGTSPISALGLWLPSLPLKILLKKVCVLMKL